MTETHPDPTQALQAPVRVAVFASGGGTTFQALLDHSRSTTTWEIALLVTDREHPGAVDRAEAADVEWVRIEVGDREPAQVGAETLAVLDRAGIGVVLLAGYLRLVPEAVVTRYKGRMLNTHPGLLPAFGGKGMYGRHVHTSVLESGARISGPTVQLVDLEYDRGRPLAQWPVPVLDHDTPDSLAERVQKVERVLYPQVVDHLVEALIAGRPIEALPFEGSSFCLTSPDSPTRP